MKKYISQKLKIQNNQQISVKEKTWSRDKNIIVKLLTLYGTSNTDKNWNHFS